MKKRFIMLGIVCLFMTGCQTAQKTILEITTIAPADSAHEETETNKEERAEDASVAVKSLKIRSSKGNPDDLSSLYQTIQTHSDHNHCKSNKHRINHLAPSGFRISNAKHKITDPDNISDKQQAAAIKNIANKNRVLTAFMPFSEKRISFIFLICVPSILHHFDVFRTAAERCVLHRLFMLNLLPE